MYNHILKYVQLSKKISLKKIRMKKTKINCILNKDRLQLSRRVIMSITPLEILMSAMDLSMVEVRYLRLKTNNCY